MLLMLYFYSSSASQEDVEKKSPFLLKLGLLFETGCDAQRAGEEKTYLSFQHKSFQDYAAARFITRRLEKSANLKVAICY